ncbi:hypothetical protein NIES2119_04720 [[Phormidium ambiguum] IAM M-71]|uniref:Calcium-binding protein n=1 Tax=[Phormidium ambiguum] IAM M-71 TaxID=454136 RepID=A0A1U7IQ76_9CYAN|nr:hypothetical protein [Phormidium ambiguum]OKH39587.1 hypothetical protein NIES2119_04720 [Phormidium ambiguum IAM M-71]
MTTQLTEIGWNGSFGSGIWTNQADIVNLGDRVIVDEGVVVNTLDGNDVISGRVGTGPSFINKGTINTGSGDDTIRGSGFRLGDGLLNTGTIKTGSGDDIIEASGDAQGLINSGTINTGDGNDIIKANANHSAPLFNTGLIETGNGDDIITQGLYADSIGNTGTINTGNGNDIINGNEFGGKTIRNTGLIETGNGDDIINQNALGSIIFNTGLITTGNGNDTVNGGIETLSGGAGSIDLGNGDDLIYGFWAQNVNGGRGFDTAKLGIAYDQTLLSVGSSFDIQIGDMNFTNVEKFVFSTGETFSLQNLQAQVII